MLAAEVAVEDGFVDELCGCCQAPQTDSRAVGCLGCLWSLDLVRWAVDLSMGVVS